MPAIIGNRIDTQPLSLGDTERRNGLYILGKPRMGKSWLMVSLALQDIENGNGLFFLDPHGDAISDIFARMGWFVRPGQYYLLNPEDADYSFGINLLECKDIGSQQARSATFARAKGVFDKLWKSTFEERPWLQLILQNSIYAFIENQGYTLAELPLFFRDRQFRNHIAGNIKYNRAVSDYWLKTFPAKSTRDQDLQMEAAQTRAEIMLGHPHVRDIVGQTKTTIDFESLMEKRARIFVKLSASLPHETKKIIGTILISELLHAIERRPPDKRNQFCIFVDEFQTFAAYQDFSTLITQAPKYGIATTLAHHDRYGQLGDDKAIIGATAAIANKVLFQLTGKDASYFAPEFKKDPPTEMRDEDVYTVSQSPFYDLLQGHNNPLVRELVDRYIRPIKERIEDIYGDREAERLIRTEYLDTANLYRIDERIEATITGDRALQRGVLGGARSEMSKAISQIDKLKQLNEEGILIRATIRILNRIFIDVMEGKLKHGQEEFSNKLIEISKAAILPQEDRRILELYIGLAYGDLSKQRIMPFECAKRQGLFKEHVKKIEHEINSEFEAKVAKFARRVWEVHDKYIERVIAFERRVYDEHSRRKPTSPDAWHPPWETCEKNERERQRSYCLDAIKDYRDGLRWYRDETWDRSVLNWGYDHEKVKILEALVRRVPNDITLPGVKVVDIPGGTIVPVNIYNMFTRDDLTQRGYGPVVGSIDGLTKLCALLAKPENHLQVKTRQRGQKAVQTRTIADMVNEMEGELTELPKYTAYAKVLQGKKVWRGKIEAKALGARQNYPLCGEVGKGGVVTRSYEDINYENLTAATRKHVCLKREEIEREIRKRQENWKPAAVDEPRVVRGKNEKVPAGPPDKPVIEPDGPPPPSRPKPRR